MLVDMSTRGEDLHTEPAHVCATPGGVSLIIVSDRHSYRIQWTWRQPPFFSMGAWHPGHSFLSSPSASHTCRGGADALASNFCLQEVLILLSQKDTQF